MCNTELEIDKIVKEMMASTSAERAKAAEYDKLSYREKLARKRGFKNYSEYLNSLAQQKGFTNRTEYLKWLAQQRGFTNYIDYQNWLAQQKRFANNAEYNQDLKFKRGIGTGLSMAENENSAQYLGIHVAERLLPKIFQEPRMMAHGNKGYDAICKNGHRIDVKSSVLRKYINNWSFHIDRNKIADAFLCIGFSGSRDDLVVEHIWLFLGTEIVRKYPVNELNILSISNTEYSLSNVAQYKLTDKVDDANNVCMLFKTGFLR